ncbi:unnamed protein product [Spodoptera exigua]|nr:unnamed protein product [Spodoptera exigua]
MRDPTTRSAGEGREKKSSWTEPNMLVRSDPHCFRLNYPHTVYTASDRIRRREIIQEKVIQNGHPRDDARKRHNIIDVFTGTCVLRVHTKHVDGLPDGRFGRFGEKQSAPPNDTGNSKGVTIGALPASLGLLGI